MSRKGVDHERFSPEARDNPEPILVDGTEELPVIGYVGRVTRDKGIAVLAAALTRLSNMGLPVRVLVVGSGEGADSEHLLIDLTRSSQYCTLVEAVTDVRPYYAAMDLLVLPSAREGFPNVVLEAAAMGLPAVVSDATGCVDSVDSTCGLVFPAGDAEALAEAIKTLVTDKQARVAMGAAARRRAITDFDPKRILDQQLDQMGMGALPCAASPDM